MLLPQCPPNFLPAWSPEGAPGQSQRRTLGGTSLATGSHREWSLAMSSIQNQQPRCGLSSFKLQGLGAPGESPEKSPERRMEGGWPARGGVLLCLTVSLLLQGKMGQEQGRPECGSVHSPTTASLPMSTSPSPCLPILGVVRFSPCIFPMASNKERGPSALSNPTWPWPRGEQEVPWMDLTQVRWFSYAMERHEEEYYSDIFSGSHLSLNPVVSRIL